MKTGLTEIICVLDKSGSMAMLRNDTIGGFNTFIEDQKQAPGEALVTLTLFDTVYKKIYSGKPLNEVSALTATDYSPDGGTALLDAVGRTIDEVGHRLKHTPEEQRPEQVLFLIMTDGEENSSHEYKYDVIKEKVQHQQDVYKWKFFFLGAGIDSFAAGANLGVLAVNTSNYTGTSKGVGHAYHAMSANVRAYRSGSLNSGFVANPNLDEDDSDQQTVTTIVKTQKTAKKDKHAN